MKRLIDLLVAVLCLIIFSPLLLICYLAVKLEDGGPAIFKQERIKSASDWAASPSTSISSGV